MVWPSIVGERIVEIVVLENLASLGHFAFAVLVGLLGCPGVYLAVYVVYQALTTFAKTIFLGEALADWSWDLAGDVVEFLAGLGLVYGVGVAGSLSGRRGLGVLCTGRGVAAVFAALAVAWAAAFARAYAAHGAGP